MSAQGSLACTGYASPARSFAVRKDLAQDNKGDLVSHRIASDLRGNRRLTALTVARLGFIPFVITFLIAHRQGLAIVCLWAFLLADQFDGAIARRQNADGPARRTLDSLSDHLAIWSVYAVMAALSYASLPIVAVLGLRDVYCALSCRTIMRERYVAIGADLPYRARSALLAGWVMAAPYISAPVRTSALAAIAGFGLIVALDLRQATSRIRAMPMSITATVISARALRTRQALELSRIPIPALDRLS